MTLVFRLQLARLDFIKLGHIPVEALHMLMNYPELLEASGEIRTQ